MCASSTFLSLLEVGRHHSLGSSSGDSRPLLNRKYHSKIIQRLKQTSPYAVFIVLNVWVALSFNLKQNLIAVLCSIVKIVT